MQVVAEVGLSHCGCLGTALAYVRAIAAAGADAAKFQDHSQDPCSRFRPGTESMFVQDQDRQSYWRRTGFKCREWEKIREACIYYEVEYIVSPFSMEAFSIQKHLSPDRWKIASSKVNDYELIDACVQTGKPVILSSGMSTKAELEAAWDRVPDSQLWVLECTSIYPCPPEKAVTGVIGWPTQNMGISDHTGKIWPSIFAASVGYRMTEVHVVFSRECFGPDVTSSITTAELKQLVEGVRFVEKMRQSDIGKDELALELKEMKEVFCGP